jgi:putative serine protease PepD
VTDRLPHLDPRRRPEGLPPVAPRPGTSGGLPPLAGAPPRPGPGLPPIGTGRSSSPPPPPPPHRRGRRPGGPASRTAALVAVVVLGAGLVGGAAAGLLDDDPAPGTTGRTPVAAPVPDPVLPASAEGDLAEAVARVSPAVVQVRTDAGSQGSGVIVEPSGRIVTNEHVVKGATRVMVLTQDQRRISAVVVEVDARQDLAVLRPENPVGRGAQLSDAPDGGLRQGEQVFAIGSPFGLQNTVTAGVVSAVGRTNDEGVPMIQIDAPINPGNSGGGLFDLDGRLVGIPTSILGPIPGNVGIGFAVPASRVRALLDGSP